MALKSSRDEIGQVLGAVGADRDESGRFFLSWSQGGRGLEDSRRGDGRRIVIDKDVLFKIRGRWVPLEGAMRRNQPRTLPLWPEIDESTPEDRIGSEVIGSEAIGSEAIGSEDCV